MTQSIAITVRPAGESFGLWMPVVSPVTAIAQPEAAIIIGCHIDNRIVADRLITGAKAQDQLGCLHPGLVAIESLIGGDIEFV